MGLEMTCECSIDGHAQNVRALLESSELILRDGIRRTIAFNQISNPSVANGRLHFTVDGQTLSLRLGPEAAPKWLKKIITMPPSLGAKLGIKEGVKVFLFNAKACPELILATARHVTRKIADADLICAVAIDLAQLEEVIAQAAKHPSCPLWTIYPKGKTSTLPEALVRNTMRYAGYIDTKVSAVSEKLSAVRYNRQ